MRNFNFLSKSSSQSCGHSSVTLASTVGSPSAHRRGIMLKLIPVLVLILTIGVGNVWGDTWSLTYTDFNTTSYSANDGSHEKGGISYTTKNVMQSSSKIQIKKSSAYIYNTTAMPGDITSITLSSGSNVVIKVGSSSQPSSGTTVSSGASVSSGNRYFYITSNGSTATVTTITVTYTAAAAKTLSSIAVKTAPTKVKYVAGENFDPSGLKITATYSDASKEDISYAAATFTLSPTTSTALTTSNTSVSITYGGKSTSQAINVYNVTMQARDEDGNAIPAGGPGAPSRTGKSITPAADANNYVFKEWSISGASLGSSKTTKSNTITNPTGAVTVTAVYYKPITITYKANGQDFTAQTYSHGGTLAFPVSEPDGATYSCTGKTFVGWVAEANKDYSHATDAPTYATEGGSVTTAATYYAVFANASTGASSSKTYSLELTGNNFAGSYDKRSSSATAYEVGGSETFSVSFTSNGVMKSSNSGNPIQFRKSGSGAGVLYNTTDLGTINSITYGSGSTNNIASTYKGSTEQPTSDGTGGYFKITNGSSVSYITSITINFTKTTGGATTYSNYETNCCTTLGSINGSVSCTSGTAATLSWSAVTGAESYKVKVPGSTSHNDWTTATSGVSVTGLTAGQNYTAYFKAFDSNGSHCTEGPESTTAFTTPKITVTGTLNPFVYIHNQGPSDAQSITVNAVGMAGNVTIAAPDYFEVCETENGTYTGSVSLTPTSGTVASTTIYVRLKGDLDEGSYGASNVVVSGNYAASVNVSVSGTVSPSCHTPSISVQPTASVSYNLNATATALSVTAAKGDNADPTLTYQWKQCATINGDYANVASNGTSSTYTPSTAAIGTIYYKCEVSSGACSKLSDAAAVTVNTPTITVGDNKTSHAFGDKAIGSENTVTISVSGAYLAKDQNIGLALSGAGVSAYSLSTNSLTASNGTVEATDVTITYTAVAGLSEATLTISSANATSKTITLSGTGKHQVTYYANGNTITPFATKLADGEGKLVLPDSDPTSCDDIYTTFIGWYSTAAGNNGSPTANISSCGTKAETTHSLTSNETYYAVFGDGGLSADEVKQVTLDFTDNTDWGFPTDAYSTTSDSYTKNGVTITMGGVTQNGWKFNSTDKYFIYGKEGCTMTFSAFSFDVSKIVVTGRSGASGKTTQNVFVGSTAVSTETTGVTGTNTYAINSSYKTAGTIYVLKVTNGNNGQATKIEIYSPGKAATGFISNCCTSLADINGAVSWSNPTTAVLTWDNIAHVNSWAVKYKKHDDANYSDFAGSITGTENKTCTISSLVCGTDYDFQIIATPEDGYCDKSQTINDNQTHKYAISLNPANGEVTGGSFLAADKACNGDDVDLLAVAAIGYAFSSWTITKASSGNVSPAANTEETTFEMPAEAVTVSAAFSLVNYTITYANMEGATNHESNPATYTINSPAITLGDPEKDGFDFGGWFTDGDLAPEHAVGTPAIAAGSTGNKTFYAKWTQAGTHTVTIADYSNGSVSVTYSGMESALTSGSRTIAENTVLTITATPNTGYEGLLTVNDVDFTSGNTHTLTADITIEALFEPKSYTITYKDKDDEDYSGSNLASLPTSHTYNTATALVDGVKAGHSFGGWFTDAACTESAGSSLGATAYTDNITLYAKWEEITMYSVTWMVNGAAYTTGTPTVEVEAGDAISNLPTAPEVCDEDLTFMGWTNAAIEGTQVGAPAVLFKTVGTAPAVTGNVTYHAVFAAANQLTATFNAAAISNLTENYTNNWTHTVTGITFFITAGQRYTKSEPNTFTVTKNSSCGLTSPDGVKIKKVILTVSEDNSTTYIADHVTPGSLATSGTTQTITSVNEEYLYIYANEDYQIRIKNFDVYYTPVSPTYSNYRTLYDASVPTPTLDVASGKYTSDQLVTIDNYDGNYMYFYTTNGSTPAADANLEPISPAVAYDSNDGIEITSTKTVKVIAYDLCHNASAVTTATYTIAESLTLAEFVEQKPTTNEKVDFTGAIVMAREDKRLYVQKDAAAMCLYYEAGAPSFAVGKQIANGIITGHYDADDLEMKVSNAGSPTATVDGVMPTPLVITDDNAETLMVEANMYRYAQMNSVTLDEDEYSYLTAYSTTSDKHYYYDDWFEVLTSKTLPLSTTECSVKGIITPYYDDVYYFDQLSPILANDISTNATAVLPTFSDLGGADAAHAVEVAEGKEITITENADFDAIYQINDGDETAINTSAVVTITNTAAATKVYVKASRDYYAENTNTYYYIANSALTEHTITCATGLAGGSISADKSAAVTGATVTLTPTPAEHYHLTSWTVTYNDGEEKTINVVNNQFTMPGYNVNVTATFTEDAYATVSFAKGDEAVTGDVPANQKVYVGDNATMPANPFTFSGHNFAGWKYNETTKQPSETYEVTASGNITFTAQWTANPICTVTLHANGADDIVTEVLQGATYNIPNAGTIVGYTFLGWATAAQNSEVTEAINVVSSFTPEVQAVASTKEFYAVYTRQEGVARYEKVTSDLGTAWAGDYLIACHPTIFANGQKGGKDDNGSIGKADVKVDLNESIVNNTIAAEYGDPYKVTLEEISANSNTYVLKTQDGKYNYQTTYDNGLVASSNKATASFYPITVTFTSEDDVKLVLGGDAAGVAFRYNASNRIFRYYKNAGMSPIYLYKYIGATTYYTTNPAVKYNVSYALGDGAWREAEGCDASVVEAETVYDVVCEYEPVLANKVFDKWQVNEADIELPYTINANTTFTAVYRDAVQYAVNYDANGGVGSAPAATNVLEAADYTVLANAWFFRSGHTFIGWNTASDGSGVAYAAEAVMAMPSANVTLYAQWQELPANNKEVVIVAKVGANYYAMGQTLSTKQFNAIAVAGVRDNKVILPDGFSDENKTAITWHMITNNNGVTAAFYSPANNKYLAGGNDLSLSNDPVDWTWDNENQCYVISGRTFMYRSSYDFRSYSTSNFGTSGYAEAMYVTTEFAKAITTADATEAGLSLGDNVVVKDGATLTIGSQQFINDVVVENGGNLTLNANLSVHDLVIHSTLGKGTGTTAQGNAPGNCGQIANGSNLTVNGNVYLELELTQDAKASAGWYAFSVPFPVDAINGVYYGNTKLQNEVGYAIMSHYGDLRAKNEYAWKKFRGIMQPGVFYVITVGNTDYKTLRFKKVAGEALVAGTSVEVSEFPSQTGNDADGAWNGIGNPNLQISNLSTAVPTIQFYDHKTNSFTGRHHSMNLVVGSAFFIQYDAASTVSIPAGTTDHNGYLAPKRVQNDAENTIYEVNLTNVTSGEMEDNLFLTAREDATSEYEIGRDVAKMSMGTAKCAQMYVPAYGTKLCAADFRLINDKATYPLTLTAPQSGTYSISVEDNDAATIYLTKDGRMIWNLSMSPCEIELPQGTTEGYGLKLIVNAPAVVTGVDEVTGDGLQVTGAQKVIIDEHVYILRGGQMYDVNGKMVK